MTPFEQSVKQVEKGLIQAPAVTMGNNPLDYFTFQLKNHIFILKILANGMKFRNTKFSDIKKYYGLKSKSAKDAVIELETINNKYLLDKVNPKLN